VAGVAAGVRGCPGWASRREEPDQLTEPATGPVDVVDEKALGDLEYELLGTQVGSLQRSADVAGDSKSRRMRRYA
jgi:hypothetical protein